METSLKIMVLQDEGSDSWHWKIQYAGGATLTSDRLDLFTNRSECLDDVKKFGRLITAWAVANEFLTSEFSDS